MTAANDSIIGTYSGDYTYRGEMCTAHYFNFQIDRIVLEGFSGRGSDGIGRFTISGTSEPGRIRFKKIYVQTGHPAVQYIGDFTEDGKSISGTWSLPTMDGYWHATIDPELEGEPEAEKTLYDPISGHWQGDIFYKRGRGAAIEFNFSITDFDGTNFRGQGSNSSPKGTDFELAGTYALSRLVLTKTFKDKQKAEVYLVADLSIDDARMTGTWHSIDGDGGWEARRVHDLPISKNIAEQNKEMAVCEEPLQIPNASPADSVKLVIPEPMQTNPVNPALVAPISQAPEVELATDDAGSSKKCSQCGTVRGAFNFCANCGHSFDLSSP